MKIIIEQFSNIFPKIFRLRNIINVRLNGNRFQRTRKQITSNFKVTIFKFFRLEQFNLESSFFAGLLCPWLRQKNFRILPSMPHFPSLPRTNPLTQKYELSIFQCSNSYTILESLLVNCFLILVTSEFRLGNDIKLFLKTILTKYSDASDAEQQHCGRRFGNSFISHFQIRLYLGRCAAVG